MAGLISVCSAHDLPLTGILTNPQACKPAYPHSLSAHSIQAADRLISVQDANLWDTSSAPTIVMTQRRARTNFQRKLQVYIHLPSLVKATLQINNSGGDVS